MVHVRAKKKGARDSGLPQYDHKCRLISVVVHTGGTFIDSTSTEYVGGRIVYLDWCNVDQVTSFDFNLYTGVEFGDDMRYYLKLKDNSYKLLIDDADIQKWACTFLDVREMHVFAEKVEDDDSEEDPNYVLESDDIDDDSIFDEEVDISECEYEAISSGIEIMYADESDLDIDPNYVLEDDNEDDDALFDVEVDDVEDEYEAISEAQIVDDNAPAFPVTENVPVFPVEEHVIPVEDAGDQGVTHEIPIEATENQLDGHEIPVPVEELEVDEDADMDMEFFEDADFSSGGDSTEGNGEDEGADIDIEDEGISFHDEFGTTDSENIMREETKSCDLEEDDSDDSSGEDDVVDTPDLFDEARFSEESDGDAEQFPLFNPKTIYKPEFVLKQVFSTKKEFKAAVQSHAINQRRNVKITKNDKRRMYARCYADDCKWMVSALKMKDSSSFQIRKILDKHSCAPSHKVKCMTSTWLSERFLQRFQSDGGRSVKGFMVDAMHDTRCEISKTQAYKAKHKALSKIEGDPDAQYSKLWAYAEELRKTNPGSTIIVGTKVDNGVTMFLSYYCCFSALKKGFKRGCRKFLGVDGCFLKGKHGGQLLTAVGVDGNNNPFPVAFAVVERESQETWEWFLSVLKSDLDLNSTDFTFMSDKQKGLIKAMETIFPGVEHRFCVRHLHNNLKLAGFRGVEFHRALWNAAFSTTEGQFNSAMKEMKKLSEACWQWFQNKPPHQWCKAFFQKKSKCDLLLNNVCETFNSNIVEARDKPIITMLEWIRESLMVRLQKNRDRALAKWKKTLCPKIQKIMNRNTEAINDCIALKSNDTNYQISCFDGSQYTVDLKKLTCSCRGWQLSGIPCTHAICAMLRQKLDPIDFVHPYYHVETYNLTYAEPIYGISYDLLWGDSMYVPPLPPKFGERVRRGRKQKKRRLEPFEAQVKGKNVTGKLQKMKKQCNPYKCKKCGVAGHNTLTCGKKPRETPSTSTAGAEPSNAAVSGAAVSEQDGVVVSEQDGAEAGITERMAPPQYRPFEDIPSQSEDVGTQQSQISVEVPTQPLMQGPTIHQQLQMAKKRRGWT